MRDLTPDDIGVLLSVFVLLLIFFGIDFRMSRTDTTRHKKRSLVFAVICLVGEAFTVLALILTWVALFLPDSAEWIDTLIVFVPGSVAMVCAVILTGEVVASRVRGIARSE